MFEIRVKSEDLTAGVSRVQSIVMKRSSLPVLANILLEAEDGKLTITATDLEIIFRGSCEAAITQTGKVTVPGKLLHDIVRAMPASEELWLVEKENGTLALSSSRSQYLLHCLPASDFPTMPDHANVHVIPMDSKDLIELIDKTIYSISTEETRYNLGGVFMEKVNKPTGKLLRFVSTDGHRLAMMDKELSELDTLSLDKGVLLSKKGLSEMKKFAEEFPDGLKFGYSGNSIVLLGGESVLILRLLEGRFPDYNLVIPKSSDKIITLNRKELLDILRRISVMSSERTKATRFSFSPKQINLTTTNPDIGEASESMPIEYEGEEVIMGFNVFYFIECLNPMKSEIIKISLKDSKNPCVIEGEEDKGFLGIIMPMKL